MTKRKAMMKAPPSPKRVSSRNGRRQATISRNNTKKLLREIVGGEPYEYYRMGRYIVSAPGICGGRPTFKYTRIDVRHALRFLSEGYTIKGLAKAWKIPIEAIQEALDMAAKPFDQNPYRYAKAA